MNQRPAKQHRAAMPREGNVSISQLIAFAESAEKQLEEADEGDAAFYFGQLAEFMKRYPEKGLNERTSRILGL